MSTSWELFEIIQNKNDRKGHRSLKVKFKNGTQLLACMRVKL